MEFLLQLMAELFTNEPVVGEANHVTEINPVEVIEIAPAEESVGNLIPEGIAPEEPNLFNIIQFH